MKYIIKLFFYILFFGFCTNSLAQSTEIEPSNIYPQVKLETSLGVIIVELDRVKAPITVNNFLSYVVSGEYDNTIFHRIIDDFIVQGGGYTEEFALKELKSNIVNESGNGLKNDAGTIAMAKESHPHTANRQFFFNVVDNNNLNPGRRWGYTVFGAITEGEDVLAAMAKVKTDYHEGMNWNDVPLEPVLLIKATLLPAL